jgi:hypothetical protein
MPPTPDLIVLHEHPEWQKPLFAALARRGVSFEPFDLTRAAFSNVEPVGPRLYFNQASPSAYIRGNTRAVPLTLAAAFGFDPSERLVDFLAGQLARRDLHG